MSRKGRQPGGSARSSRRAALRAVRGRAGGLVLKPAAGCGRCPARSAPLAGCQARRLPSGRAPATKPRSWLMSALCMPWSRNCWMVLRGHMRGTAGTRAGDQAAAACKHARARGRKPGACRRLAMHSRQGYMLSGCTLLSHPPLTAASRSATCGRRRKTCRASLETPHRRCAGQPPCAAAPAAAAAAAAGRLLLPGRRPPLRAGGGAGGGVRRSSGRAAPLRGSGGRAAGSQPREPAAATAAEQRAPPRRTVCRPVLGAQLAAGEAKHLVQQALVGELGVAGEHGCG